MKVSVLIPTYKRPESLRRCLEGLLKQERAADEILVVTQAKDAETQGMLDQLPPLETLRILRLTQPGAVAQYNAGLDAMQGDIVAITDDDTIPRSDWLARIEKHFLASSDLGALGGLDLVHVNGRTLTGKVSHVGIVRWFGRIVGNHHLGSRFRSSIDVLKGANMACRATAVKDVRFDTDLRGTGAQTYLDMAFSFDLRTRGWRLLYDPAVIVDHYPASRFDADQRGRPSLEAAENTSFNFYLTLLRHMPGGWQKRMALVWARTVGVATAPGSLRGIAFNFRKDPDKLALRAAAVRAWKQAQALTKSR